MEVRASASAARYLVSNKKTAQQGFSNKLPAFLTLPVFVKRTCVPRATVHVQRDWLLVRSAVT